ncbi:DUF4328 domain-containing protein [uncultured Kingella sp.]|uniref:DUF4328 domain-containing protein n=1 Tax=uncultured Kingella sp. TaxID=159270 RepID=UPI0025913D8D|nr:DUF4328 domain-containing protein [uncultured Kingella sp.]
MKRTYTYQLAAGLGKWVAAAVWLFVLLKISVVAVGVLMLIAVYQPMQTALANQRSLAGLNIPITDTVLNLMNYAETVVFLVSMVFIACWILRAHANAQSFRIPNLPDSPAWALGSFFIPLVNFVAPYIAMKQLYQGSLKCVQSQPSAALLPLWWATWLIGGIVARVARSFAVTAEQEANIAHNAHDLLNAINIQIWANQMAILSVICHIACALLLLRIIQQINRAHASLHAANTSETAVAPVGVNNAVNFYTSTAK